MSAEEFFQRPGIRVAPDCKAGKPTFRPDPLRSARTAKWKSLRQDSQNDTLGQHSKPCAEFADVANHGDQGLFKRSESKMTVFTNNICEASHSYLMRMGSKPSFIGIMMAEVLFGSLFAIFLLVNPVLSWAASLDGTWKYERAADYYGRAALDRLNHFDTLIVKGSEIRFARGCTVHFAPEDYFFSEVFQPFAKGDVTEKQVDSFLSKKFGVTLSKVKVVYSLAGAATCAEPVMEFFQIGDRIIVPVGATFYSYVKTAHEDSAGQASPSFGHDLGFEC